MVERKKTRLNDVSNEYNRGVGQGAVHKLRNAVEVVTKHATIAKSGKT